MTLLQITLLSYQLASACPSLMRTNGIFGSTETPKAVPDIPEKRRLSPTRDAPVPCAKPVLSLFQSECRNHRSHRRYQVAKDRPKGRVHPGEFIAIKIGTGFNWSSSLENLTLKAAIFPANTVASLLAYRPAMSFNIADPNSIQPRCCTRQSCALSVMRWSTPPLSSVGRCVLFDVIV